MEVFLSVLHSLFVIVPHMKEEFSKKLGRQQASVEVGREGGRRLRQLLRVLKECITCGWEAYVFIQNQHPHSA